MKILIVSYHFYPENNPRAFRWYEISKQLVNKGIHVDVVTCKNSSSFEIKDGIKIFRVGLSISNFKDLKNNNDKKNKSKSLLTFLKKSILKFIYLILKLLYKYTFKKLYWPDFAFLWFFAGTHKSKELMKNQNYDKIITVSHPFTCHLIGLSLKKKYPDLFWLADSGDPFSFSEQGINNTSLYKKVNYKIERMVFEKSDKLTFTTEGTVNKYSRLFPESFSKYFVIPPLVSFSEPKLNSIDIFDNTKNKKIILSYFGVLYNKIRNPNGLLFMLDSLINSNSKMDYEIQLHFFGDHTSCIDSFQSYSSLSKNIIFHGHVSKEIALLSMQQSNILINIGNITNYQLPSKIIEYIGASKPIINIISILDDSSKIYLDQFPYVFNYKIHDDIDVVNEFIRNSKGIKIDNSLVQKFVLKHSPNVIANQYLKILINENN